VQPRPSSLRPLQAPLNETSREAAKECSPQRKLWVA
jgi:hypothetical protein